MGSSLRRSLVFLIVSLILIFVSGFLCGFSYDRMFSPFGFALAFFFAFMLVFLVIFGLAYLVNAWRLESNAWVVDVKEMGYWYNPMYWTWVFYHDHKKWAKWTTIFFSVFTVSLGTPFVLVIMLLLSGPPITSENFSWTNFLTGWAVATALMIPFTFSWYLYYTGVDRTPSPYPQGRLSDLPRRL